MISKIVNRILRIIFPPKCVLCDKIVEDEDSLCCDCWKKIRFINRPFCDRCSAPFEFKVADDDICLTCMKNEPLYVKSRSAVVYNSDVAKIIFKFKFYDKIHMKRFMGKCMCRAASDIIDNINILIPIPLHKKRLIHRKYNQSLLLADEIAKNSGKIVLHDFLYKTKHTVPQASLKQNERQNNLKNKFAINPKYLKDIKKYENLGFAIVDDVITTGSTINESIKVMREAGINNIYAISFAKTVIK